MMGMYGATKSKDQDSNKLNSKKEAKKTLQAQMSLILGVNIILFLMMTATVPLYIGVVALVFIVLMSYKFGFGHLHRNEVQTAQKRRKEAKLTQNSSPSSENSRQVKARQLELCNARNTARQKRIAKMNAVIIPSILFTLVPVLQQIGPKFPIIFSVSIITIASLTLGLITAILTIRLRDLVVKWFVRTAACYFLWDFVSHTYLPRTVQTWLDRSSNHVWTFQDLGFPILGSVCGGVFVDFFFADIDRIVCKLDKRLNNQRAEKYMQIHCRPKYHRGHNFVI